MRPKFALKLGIKKVIIKLDLHFACCDKALKLELTKWKDSSLLNRCLISLPLRGGGVVLCSSFLIHVSIGINVSKFAVGIVSFLSIFGFGA